MVACVPAATALNAPLARALSSILAANARAFTVLDADTVNAPVYSGDALVGIDPSVV